MSARARSTTLQLSFLDCAFIIPEKNRNCNRFSLEGGLFFSGERHENPSGELCNLPLLCHQNGRKIFRFQVGRAVDKAKSKTYNSTVNFEAVATDPGKG